LGLTGCGFVTVPLESALVGGAGLAVKGTVYGFREGQDLAMESANYVHRQSLAASRAIDAGVRQLLGPASGTGNAKANANAAAPRLAVSHQPLGEAIEASPD
jgi:hypothetical protein